MEAIGVTSRVTADLDTAESRPLTGAERTARWRANQRKKKEQSTASESAPSSLGTSGVKGPEEGQRTSSASTRARPTVHRTLRFEAVRSSPPRSVPPPVAAAPPTEAELEADSAAAAEDAAKFAAIVAALVGYALTDALEHNGERLAPLFARFDLEPARFAVGATAFVHRRAERVAIKYGLSLTIPYEDEIVTFGAVGASAVYLYRRHFGDAKPKQQQQQTSDAGDGQGEGDGDGDGDAGRIYGG
jgi:hypothetical protein